MANVYDVAKRILDNQGSMTHMKLQKLVCYCQAWSLVWDEAPMFPEKVEAWANGPIVRELYEKLRGRFQVFSDDISGDVASLDSEQIETIESVLETYGDKSSQWLSDLTHMEVPWVEARNGLSPRDRGSEEITHSAMAEYYSSL